MNKCKINQKGKLLPCDKLKEISSFVILTYDRDYKMTKLTFADKSSCIVNKCRFCGSDFMKLDLSIE